MAWSSTRNMMLRSTPPSREATAPAVEALDLVEVAIHAPLAGGDITLPVVAPWTRCCDPRPPRGRRRPRRLPWSDRRSCDPRPPRGRRHGYRQPGRPTDVVAIHAPLAGGDPRGGWRAVAEGVAIHAPLAGGDTRTSNCCGDSARLRSTPPSREATWATIKKCSPLELRSTPPSREATLYTSRTRALKTSCDPRPPRGRRPFGATGSTQEGGCDPRPPRGRRHPIAGRTEPPDVLRSTPPSREATRTWRQAYRVTRLRSTPPSREATPSSTPAPRRNSCDPRPPRGRRRRTPTGRSAPKCCDPRPPRGRRLPFTFLVVTLSWLRSTPPSREATLLGLLERLFVDVAIHAPLAGGDPDRSNALVRRTIEGKVREHGRPLAWRVDQPGPTRPVSRTATPSSASARDSREGHESCRFARAEPSSD